MSVMLDGKLVFVLNLVGFNWPQADEDKLKESARHWREYASELEYVIADSTRILNQIRAENSGESIDALEQHWQQFGEHLRQAHDAAGVVAEVLDGFALMVEALKVAVLVQLGILAAELAATTGAAFLTFGLAEAAAPEEIVLTQVIMRGLSREAIHKAERLVAERITKTVTEKFLTIKNGLKALKASPTVLKDFGKGLVKGGPKDLEAASKDGIRLPNDRITAPPTGRGVPPTGDDTFPVELHHRNQGPNDPLDEMTRTDHRGAGNFTANHPNTGQSPSQIDRVKFKQEKLGHWNDEWDAGRWDAWGK
jgi:A nuclease of the HNH/ENDO VII superfamily with conserved LHH